MVQELCSGVKLHTPGSASNSVVTGAVTNGGPFLQQYPKNIFTLFGGKTAVNGIEPVTSLCPHSVCHSEVASTFGFDVGRYVKFVRDAGYVYGHRVLPPIARTRIPSIEGTWGGFGAVANKFKEQFDTGAFSQVDAISDGVDAFVNDSSQRVEVVHALVPHAPWRLTPDHRVAPLSASISTQNPDNEDVVRDTYQTFLVQVGAADNAISDLIESLKKWTVGQHAPRCDSGSRHFVSANHASTSHGLL